jgi:hypothetical protein
MGREVELNGEKGQTLENSDEEDKPSQVHFADGRYEMFRT